MAASLAAQQSRRSGQTAAPAGRVGSEAWPEGRARPDFFIIGAPRCGTTSLFAYLSANPSIFMTGTKEPKYFCSDLPTPLRKVQGLQEYGELYPPVGCDLVCGEATPWYLYSRVAVPAILRCHPEAKFIVMLRDPTAMAESLYAKHCLVGLEEAPTFEAAWQAQRPEHLADRRLDGPPIPNFPYGDVCALGQQLRRLYAQVSRARVRVVFLEDLARDPRVVIGDVASFLEVEPVTPAQFTAHNVGRQHRGPSSQRVWSHVRQHPVYRTLKQTANRLGLHPGRWVQDKILTAPTNGRERRSPLLATIRKHFRSEVLLLQELTGRSLRHWLPALVGLVLA